MDICAGMLPVAYHGGRRGKRGAPTEQGAVLYHGNNEKCQRLDCIATYKSSADAAPPHCLPLGQTKPAVLPTDVTLSLVQPVKKVKDPQ